MENSPFETFVVHGRNSRGTTSLLSGQALRTSFNAALPRAAASAVRERYVKVLTLADVRVSAAAQNQRASQRILSRTAHPHSFEDSHVRRRPANCHRVRVVAVEQDHRLKTGHRLEDQPMKRHYAIDHVRARGLARDPDHAFRDRRCFPGRFRHRGLCRGTRRGLLAPLLGISPTGEFGLTLSGTLFSWGCATILLATVNLLRFGTLRRNRRVGAKRPMGPLANTGPGAYPRH